MCKSNQDTEPSPVLPDKKEEYNHATIITKISNNEIYYSAHSSNRLNAKLSKKIDDRQIQSVYIISLKNNAK